MKKTVRELLIFSIASAVFIYVVSIFTFHSGYKSLIYYPNPSGSSMLGQFGAVIASGAFFMIGKAAYYMSVPLVLLILAVIFQKKTWLHYIKWGIILMVALSGFYGLFAPDNAIIQGGLIGNFTGKFLRKLFGLVGTSLLLFSGMLWILSRMFPDFTHKLYGRIMERYPQNNDETLSQNQCEQKVQDEKAEAVFNEEASFESDSFQEASPVQEEKINESSMNPEEAEMPEESTEDSKEKGYEYTYEILSVNDGPSDDFYRAKQEPTVVEPVQEHKTDVHQEPIIRQHERPKYTQSNPSHSTMNPAFAQAQEHQANHTDTVLLEEEMVDPNEVLEATKPVTFPEQEFIKQKTETAKKTYPSTEPPSMEEILRTEQFEEVFEATIPGDLYEEEKNDNLAEINNQIWNFHHSLKETPNQGREEELKQNLEEKAQEPKHPGLREIIREQNTVESSEEDYHKPIQEKVPSNENIEEVHHFQNIHVEQHNTEEDTIIQRPVKSCLKNFEFPTLDMLESGDEPSYDNQQAIRNSGIKLLGVLREFNIHAKLNNIVSGPVVTRYEITPPKGLKISKLVGLVDNIALGIAAYDKIRMEAPIPGKSAVGIEVPNAERQLVTLKDLLELEEFHTKKMAIPVALGKGISGKPHFTDLSKIPHLLIAGSTGSGKSVCVNSLICSILYSKKPDEVKLILVDPKRVELKMYEDLPHLLTPVIKEASQAVSALNWAVSHMEERYKQLESYNVRNIKGYNQIRKQEGKSPLPYLVIVIDEFADRMMIGKREVEEPIIRLAQMARAVGIHLVLATQRPSADVITGLIKANFPGRISCKVASKVESRIILDINGAENLIGKGDMLYTSPNLTSIARIQSPFISDEEVHSVTEFFKARYQPNYLDEIVDEITSSSEVEAMDPTEEPLFNEAVEIVVKEGKASASYLQRRMKIGYNRAARIIEMMEEMGIVGPASGSKPRNVLIDHW